MIPKSVLILLFFFIAITGQAQPTLPDITGTIDKGVVVLTWNCQYQGLKSISVLRSTDSLHNYTDIGNVKNVNKGVQAFVDGHPAAGRNYYKLNITFGSGLKWNSNFFGVYADIPIATAKQLPSNDSLQKFIVTSNHAKSAQDEKKSNTTATGSPNDPKHKISLSFEIDTTHVDAKTWLEEGKHEPSQRQKILISFDDPETSAATLTKSRFITIESATGHVFMNLPDDVKQHHYSIKFYTLENKMIIEIPKIFTPQIIIDKRNFQRKGTYKFILRKDVTELETGYITIY